MKFIPRTFRPENITWKLFLKFYINFFSKRILYLRYRQYQNNNNNNMELIAFCFSLFSFCTI